MATKKFEDIMKELEEFITAIKETNDDVSKLFDEAENEENGFKEFAEIGENLIHYTFDNLIDAKPADMAASYSVPKIAEKIVEKKYEKEVGKLLAKKYAKRFAKGFATSFVNKLAVAELVGSAIAAPFDYGSDNLEQLYRMSELAQDINNYTAAYNEGVKSVEVQFKLVDEYEHEATSCWKEIHDLVDGNGKLKNPQNIEKLQENVDNMTSLGVELIGDQIQDYPDLVRTMEKRIKEKCIQYKKDFLQFIYDEAHDNLGKVKKLKDESFSAQDDAHKTHDYVKYMYEEAGKHRTPDGYEDYNFNVFIDAAKLAEKISDEANLNYSAIADLYNSYKRVIKMYYDLEYPDAEKTLAQLDGEAYAKREREKHTVSPEEYKLKANLEHESKYLDTEKSLAQLDGEAYAKRMKEKHSSKQPISDIVQNNIYTRETADMVRSMNNAVINQAAVLPEAIKEIVQQPIAAFTERLLMDGDKYLGEHIAEAAQEICNIGYGKGSEFAEGGNDSLSSADINDILSEFMAAREAMMSEMMMGQQFKSYNYYGGATQAGSNKSEKIVLENKADITVKLDRDVLGKSMMEWKKEYERRTST